MLAIERLASFDKSELEEVSKTLCREDLPKLVEWLADKDDTIRYNAFLLLHHRSSNFNDVYPFWDVFYEKLKMQNSYQRSLGLMLISDNVKWDKNNKIDSVIDEYLLHLNDEKPITVRQCIQSLTSIVQHKSHLSEKIAERLMGVDIESIKETMQKLVLSDILKVLAVIRRYQTNDDIEDYIVNALSGGRLDKKTTKEIEMML